MTKLQDKCIAAHPEFPWLEAGNVEQLEGFLRDRHWLRAGEGNMNLTLRLRTDRRTMILKQARPWVEKYAHIGAPWDRILFERRFYERAASLPKVAAAMPRLMATDADAHVILMEDVGEGAISRTCIPGVGSRRGSSGNSRSIFARCMTGRARRRTGTLRTGRCGR